MLSFRSQRRMAFQPESAHQTRFGYASECRSGAFAQNQPGVRRRLSLNTRRASKTRPVLLALERPCPEETLFLLQRRIRTKDMQADMHVTVMRKRPDMQIMRMVDVFTDLETGQRVG